MFKLFQRNQATHPEVQCSENEIKIANTVRGATYMKEQLELNCKRGVLLRILADGNPSTTGQWKKNYPEYFYEISLKEGSGDLTISGDEKALECAIEALIKGRMLSVRHFENGPTSLFIFAQEVASRMPSSIHR